MKKYGASVIVFLLHTHTAISMDHAWVEQCQKTYQSFRSFVDNFDHTSLSEETNRAITTISEDIGRLLETFACTIIPPNKDISLETKELFFKNHQALLFHPWLNADESVKFLHIDCESMPNNVNENMALMIAATHNSFATQILALSCIDHNANPSEPYSPVLPTPPFTSLNKKLEYENALFPLQKMLLEHGASTKGSDYELTNLGLERINCHVFARVNYISPRLLTFLVHHGERENINKLFASHKQRDDDPSTRRAITPFAYVLKNAPKEFTCAREIPVLHTLLNHGARLDVEGTQEAFPAFVTFLTTAPMPRKDFAKVNRCIKRLLNKHITTQQDLTRARTIISHHVKKRTVDHYDLWNNMSNTVEKALIKKITSHETEQ